MTESLSDSSPELERENGLAQILEQYFSEDKDFIIDMEFNDALGLVYGQLIEQGEDPDKVLHEFGVVEESDEV